MSIPNKVKKLISLRVVRYMYGTQSPQPALYLRRARRLWIVIEWVGVSAYDQLASRAFRIFTIPEITELRKSYIARL